MLFIFIAVFIHFYAVLTRREESAPSVVKVMGLGDKEGDISGSTEVELAPLLTNTMNNYPQAITSLRQAKMSVILQNNGELQLGLHT